MKKAKAGDKASDAIKLQLAHTVKELKIEAALEKVRVVALNMKEPADMLKICKTISQQLAKLGVKEIRNVQTAIFYESRGTYMNYEFYAKHNKTIITETLYTNHKIAKAFANKMLKGKDEFYITHIKGQRVKEWLAYQKTTNVFIDNYLNTASSLNYYWHSLGPVALGISTYAPLSKDDLTLFNRFLNVFELAYRRYLDIEKASAQTREAQIELGLERVRARAMAMQNSDELSQLVGTVFNELNKLDFSLASCIIWINNPVHKTNELWIASDKMNQPARPLQIVPFYPPFFSSIISAWKEKNPKWIFSLSGHEKKKFETLFFHAYPELPAVLKKPVSENKQIVFSASFNNFGALEIVATAPLTDDKFEILHRFGNVFNISYTRFNDLLKAEAQTREAQIEVAVERVRAKALAMHKPGDLHSVVVTLKKELGGLQIPDVMAATIYLNQDDGTIRILDLSNAGNDDEGLPELAMNKVIRMEDIHPKLWINRMWRRKENYFIEEADKADFDVVIDWLYSIDKAEGKIAEKIIREKKINKAWLPTVKLEKGILNIDLLQPPAPEIESILLKIGAAFDLAYKRFLDLQKAEAQVREAEIQLALERVRARTMAMHHSEEITDTVKMIYQEIDKLKLNNESTDIEIGIIDEETGIADVWAHFYLSDGSITRFKFPFNHFPVVQDEFKKWKSTPLEKRNELFFTSEFSGKKWKEFIAQSKLLPELEEIFRPLIEAKIGKWVTHNAYFSHGVLTLQGTDHYSQVTLEIQKRFAKVFEQTYTRFLDLQKAEAQAKEAQIQLALERARAQSMMMQHSKELDDTLRVFHEQVLQLGIRSAFSFLWLPDEENDRHIFWAIWAENLPAGQAGNSTVFKSKGINYPMDRNEPATAQCLVDWKNKQVVSYPVYPEGVESYFAAWSELIEGAEHLKPEYFREGLYYVEAFIKYGCFGVLVKNDLAEDEKKILYRFAVEFERTYTRFLDLQKAEAQAREAQIEVSLERVRSKAMAMHKTDDLTSVVEVVFNELDKLQLGMMRCGIAILHKDKRTADVWTTAKSETGMNIQTSGDEPMDIHPLLRGDFDAWLRLEDFSYVLKGKDLDNYYQVLTETNFHLPDSASFERVKKDRKQYYYVTPFEAGTVFAFRETEFPAEAKIVMKRFANVFNLTYKRFLDIQKAEAQAREAQIELSLERIRVQVTAMHQSTDILDIVVTMHSEFTKLGHEAHYFWHMRWLPDKYDKAMTSGDGSRIGMIMELPRHIHGDIKLLADWEKTDEPSVVFVMDVDTAVDYIDKMITLGDFKLVDHNAPTLDDIRHIGGLTFVMARTTHGEIGYSLPGVVPHPPAEDIATLVRFAGVFDLAYKRFEDLQKSEKRARETQIELALEKVRSRSMGMQKSEELKEVIRVVYEQFVRLNILIEHTGFIIDYKARDDMHIWLADRHEVPSEVTIPYFDCAHWNSFNEANEKGLDFFANQLSFEEKNKFYQDLFKLIPGVPEETLEYYFSCPGLAISTVLLENVGLYIENFSGTPYTDEENNTLMRFGKVFQQTYTRFLDLQKAEAQAREAQIQLALERVRARTMAMQKSEELQDAAILLFQQIKSLGVETGSCGFNIWDKNEKTATVWMSSAEGGLQAPFKLPHTESAIYKQVYTAMKNGEDFLVKEVKGKALEIHFDYLLALPVIGDVIKSLRETGYTFPKAIVYHFAFFNNGYLSFHLHELHPETHDIFKRFAKVFEQTYTRFLDLQKAEAQAKEAEIELALERVRATTMAMHSSDDVSAATATMFTELEKLGIENLRGGITIIKPDQIQEVWSITNLADGKKIRAIGVFNMRLHPFWQAIFKTWKAKGDYLYYWLAGKDKEQYVALLNAAPNYLSQPIKGIPDLHVQSYFFGEGAVWSNSLQPHSEQDKQIMKKFAYVFSLTFRRYQDLQKAEAQAREAHIETALEKVRSRTMAMQRSNELPEAATLLYHQLQILGMPAFAAGYCIWEDEKKAITLWMSSEGVLQPPFKAPTTEDELFIQMRKGYDSGKSLHIVEMGGEELVAHYQYMRTLPVVGEIFNSIMEAGHQLPVFQVMHYAYFSKGFLLIITYEPVPDAHTIFKRFAAVFEQTYTRFLDLQKAEFQTRQAKIETALEKVRARALAMQQPEELTEVAQVMRHEMGLLGVEELETSSIYIHDDASDNAECWYAIKDSKIQEKKLVSDHFKLNLQETWVSRQMYAFYQSKEKQISIPMQGANRKEWINYCSKQSKLLDGFYGEVIPDRTYHLYKFSNGTIGAATPGNISSESWDLLQRAASVFSLAYSRFKDLTQARIDLQKLKEEKQRAEDALTELQVTQKQLIQSEKMASLGELTAGIAHEIQNPLNFVNNFSDVSSELVDEMNEEIAKGNLEDAKQIAEDLKQNLEKINHHGKRAGDIVKGMLQHSRTSSATKEPTDINKLADEYLRLAYHGLRAKDKTFNATMKTDFDESIGNISIIPQDIGRVILNLITNAFYVVNEKSKQNIAGYEPTVTISTSSIQPPSGGRSIQIKVSDNGGGIPQNILDKIFQPFFTTKPTGQGTGLGLSLSYDIVKAHGGELKVETKEGVGAEFIIHLPF